MTKPVDIEELRDRLHQLPTFTMYQGETLRKALNAIDELEAARAKIAALKNRFRGKVVVHRFGGFVGCDACGQEWRRSAPEKHKPGCLADLEEGDRNA